jgi:hypothetical protein
MSNIDSTLYLILMVWIPLISMIGLALSIIIGLFFKYKGKSIKKIIIIGEICMAIVIIYIIILIIIGIVGFGPGLSDSLKS